jgi:predicted enzyme related to lactoylglutathione lyase
MANNPANQPDSADPGVEPQLARNGGLSYLEIPAIDLHESATFYENVLGWSVQLDGTAAKFRDQTGHLIGRWLTGRAISRDAGLLPYIYVDRLEGVVERVPAHGGQLVKLPFAEGNLTVAIVRDPAGNLIGLWQEGRP